jgi:outer membrane protein OmpA-like peptidoglycan-associated protein
MNYQSSNSRNLMAAAVAAVLLGACSSTLVKPDGADGLQLRLTQLQTDPNLGSRAPLAMQKAAQAVSAAEQPQSDPVVATHLVFMADRSILIARADAQSQYEIDQRKALGEQREEMRLRARTQEADAANARASVAQASARDEKQAAENANRRANDAEAIAADQALQADAARDAAARAQHDADELAEQITLLQARVTDRGLVLTLGDVLFSSGTATLNGGGNGHLDKLAGFLNRYPGRTAVIDGYTDSIGSDDYNQGLSERRAEAVKNFLIGQGIDAPRLTAAGMGKSSPVASNGTATGRQQNRRVEVTISNPPVAVAASAAPALGIR